MKTPLLVALPYGDTPAIIATANGNTFVENITEVETLEPAAWATMLGGIGIVIGRRIQ